MNKNPTKTRSKGKSTNSIPPFLHKIYEILENSSYFDLVSWNEDGNAFIIKNVTEFTEKVLPKYFKHSNFASFVRQLNLYDFHKSRYDNNGNEFYHKLFKRGEKNLLAEIKRKMPNENTNDSPSQFLQAAEELEAERAVPGLMPVPLSLQDLINRQDRLENAVKMLTCQNKQLIKENKVLWSEMSTLKTKQSNTEKATRLINGQNSQLLKDNRCLWGDLIMNREKYEKQVEKLFLFLISVIRCQGNNSRTIFKKKNFRGATLNTNTEEETHLEEPSKTENNPFSVLPMKKITKFLSNKKAQSQLDKLLECLEQEGINSLFSKKPFLFEGKDLSVQLSALLDHTEDNNFPSLGFLSDKRPPPLDHSLEREDPRETSAKICKIEGDGTWDSTVAVITEENPVEKLRVSKRPSFEGLSLHNKMVDISSPMHVETAGCEFELSPLNLKHQLNLGEDNFLHIPENLFGKQPHSLNHFSEDEAEEEEKSKNDKKDMSSLLLKPVNRSRSTSQHENHNKGECGKMEEILSWLNNEVFHDNNANTRNDAIHHNFIGNALTFDQNT